MKKIIWMILTIAIVAALAACMPGGAGGGGEVHIGGQPITAEGGAPQAAVGGQATQPAAPAGGQPAEAPDPMGGMLGMFIPIILLFAVMYFFIMRPQRKQAKAAKEMQEGLRVGENVITTSGFFGKIVGVGTDAFLVEFGQDRGVKVWVRKSDIAGVRSPVMTPPPTDDKKDDKK